MLLNLLFLILGLLMGSFVSAVSFRIVRGIQFSNGRSFCDKCKKSLTWRENIPLFSYIFLKGRCLNCKRRISIRYPLVEIATAIGFVSIYNYFLPTLQGLPLQGVYSFIFALASFLILEIIFITDIEHQVIPDEAVFFGILMSVLYFLLLPYGRSLYSSLFSGFISASMLMFVNIATHGRGMGLGDVKFAILGGLLVGTKLVIPWMFLSFLTGATVAIILILTGSAKLKDKIAFGPFLVVSLPLAFLLGEKIINLWTH